MVAAVRSVLSALADALEMACGWALLTVGFYALLFIDVTGDGSVWSALCGLSAHARAPVESAHALRRITVAARASAEQTQEDRLLLVLKPERKEDDISVEVPADIPRPEAAFTDAPAEPKAGASWTKSLQGRLRSFTVYGQGEQTTSATAATERYREEAAPPHAVVMRPIVAAPGSAADFGSVAAVRPGMGARLNGRVAVQSDSVRNIR